MSLIDIFTSEIPPTPEACRDLPKPPKEAIVYVDKAGNFTHPLLYWKLEILGKIFSVFRPDIYHEHEGKCRIQLNSKTTYPNRKAFSHSVSTHLSK